MAKVADGPVVVERPERHARATERVQNPTRPSGESSARSISPSHADEVSRDERATARHNDERAGDRSRSRTDHATAVSARIFGIQSPHEVFKQTSAVSPWEELPFLSPRQCVFHAKLAAGKAVQDAQWPLRAPPNFGVRI